MNDLIGFAIAFAQSHSGWAAPIVFSLAFCESFAFVSLFLPTASILFGAGGVIGASGVQFWSVWLSATLGAFTAHWLAYSLAVRFKNHITHLWPLSRNPEIVAGGTIFFDDGETWLTSLDGFSVHCAQSYPWLRAYVKCLGSVSRSPILPPPSRGPPACCCLGSLRYNGCWANNLCDRSFNKLVGSLSRHNRAEDDIAFCRTQTARSQYRLKLPSGTRVELTSPTATIDSLSAVTSGSLS